MRTIEIKVPDTLDIKDYDFLIILASKLYEDAKLTSGQAAKMVGVSKKTFIELWENMGFLFSGNRKPIYIPI